jgi:hypothetical protein
LSNFSMVIFPRTDRISLFWANSPINSTGLNLAKQWS